MSARSMILARGLLAIALAALGGVACDGKSSPQTIDSQTNWLRSCRNDSQCGDESCVCGVCTKTCADDAACAGLPGSACVASGEDGAVAQCDGTHAPGAGLCLPRCEDAACPAGNSCVAGACTPTPMPNATVEIDTSTTHQTLVGFGATVAYGEDAITSHPQKAALYRALFAGLGLDVLRLRDRYGHTGDDDLAPTRALLDAAAASLDHAPTVIMASWSPPPALKASGAAQCSGNPGTCTLTKTAGGEYDYAGFAAYLRASLDAYAKVGVTPDYFGIQNNPNWVPTAAEPGDACRFLPVEGTEVVTVAGAAVTVPYPGYAEALDATLDALTGLATPPKLLAPDTSDFLSVEDFTSGLDWSRLGAVAHHLYGVNPASIDLDELGDVGELASGHSLPIFQTEMQADGFGTAQLIHYSTTVEGASAYLQSALVGSATGPDATSLALAGIDDTTFYLYDPYYALQHYALHTEPGWQRVDATSSDARVLTSAWRAPNGGALTVVLVNTGVQGLDVELTLPADAPANSSITRSVFGGSERAAELGSLPPSGDVRVPGRSVVTVALSN